MTIDAGEHYAWVLFEAALATYGDRPRTWQALDAWLDALPHDLSPHSSERPTTTAPGE